MDIAICGSRPDNAFTPKKDAAMNFVDSRELRFFANGMNAINWQQRAYPQVQYRYLFYEELFLPIFELLDFNNSTTWKLQESGRQQAKETMEMGEGIGFKALESWLEDEKNLREEYGSFMKYMRSFAAAIF